MYSACHLLCGECYVQVALAGGTEALVGGDLDMLVTTDALGLGVIPKERMGRDRSRAGLHEAPEDTGNMSGKAVRKGLERRGKEQRGPPRVEGGEALRGLKGLGSQERGTWTYT